MVHDSTHARAHAHARTHKLRGVIVCKTSCADADVCEGGGGVIHNLFVASRVSVDILKCSVACVWCSTKPSSGTRWASRPRGSFHATNRPLPPPLPAPGLPWSVFD